MCSATVALGCDHARRADTVGGTSKHGKSIVLRLLAAGLALDPTVELHVADLKGDGDWSGFKPRPVTLIEGSADEHAEATTEMLEWGVGVDTRIDQVLGEPERRVLTTGIGMVNELVFPILFPVASRVKPHLDGVQDEAGLLGHNRFQPTIFRENTSMVNTVYTVPAQVLT